jgi:hypothetical protein
MTKHYSPYGIISIFIFVFTSVKLFSAVLNPINYRIVDEFNSIPSYWETVSQRDNMGVVLPSPTSIITPLTSPTFTITPSPTAMGYLATGTLTQAASPASPTVTGFPSRTATPVPPTQTATMLYTPSITPSTTLLPLPVITLIFPAYTTTNTVTATPQFSPTPETTQSIDKSKPSNLTPRLILLVGILIILWVVLAGFLVVFFRQLKR